MNNDRFKFRVWDNEKKSYSNMIYFISEEGELYGTDNFDMAANDSYYLHETLCDDMFDIEQCTGLKDKNGKLIYEGDILNINYGGMATHEEIRWNQEQSMFTNHLLHLLSRDKCSKMEIIGNIHEKESK